MKFRSITSKLLFLVIGAFIVTILSVLVVADSQLTKIIDRSQSAMYAEKIDVIWNELYRTNIRLQKTGLVEAYSQDFKNKALSMLRETYYKQDEQVIYPFIIGDDVEAIMHPTLPNGDRSIDDLGWVRDLLVNGSGSFVASYKGVEKWYIFKKFEPWGWSVGYAVPLTEKYKDVRTFRNILIVIMLGLTFVVLAVLSVILVRFTKPIVKLTEISAKIAEGNLNQDIKIGSGDELGILAGSFKHMQNSIKQKIADLKLEISERQRAEEELKTARNYISNIIDSMPSLLVGVDAEGKVTQWNKTAEQTTGHTMADAHGRYLLDLFPEVAPEMEKITESIRTLEIKKEQNKPRYTENGVKYEDLTIYPLRADGVKGAVIRIDDVSKEHELEMQLGHSRKMDAIGQLAGGVAHDFNNMLGGIMGAAQILDTKFKCKENDAATFIDIIIKASTRAADLTTKLLAFGRKGKLISTPVDVHYIISETVAILNRTIDKKVGIVCDTTAEANMVIGDASQLQSAVMNLALNASQAMPDGGTINFSTRNTSLDSTYCDTSPFSLEPGQYIDIEIRDTGCGISRDDLTKIFEPFFTTKDQGKGTGLGLSAVYGTVQEHHGAVTVSSEVGVGTSFNLLLKCSEANANSTKENAEVISGAGLILLVDDEEIIRLTVEHILKELGYHVLLAENGREAVELFQERHKEIDLVIMDMVMPEMNGCEAFCKMKETDKDGKIIISSGFAKNESITRLSDKGLSGFIRKPYRGSELSQLLADVLKN